MREGLIVFVTVGSALALIYAFVQFKRIFKFSEGNETMQKISAIIRLGANAFMKRQYTGVAMFFACMFVVLGIMAFLGFITPFVPFAFLTGGFFSGISGVIGMKAATYANARTAQAASESLNRGLRIAFSAGSVMGFTVVGMALLDISLWYILLRYVFLPTFFSHITSEAEIISYITSAMLTFAMGSSSVALFARVGGGIFTKAADVGSDLVGKVEAGIPEDDPRNPATIADNVGDNVGDVAGLGADLFESYVGSIVASMALAVAAGYGFSGVIVPPLIAVVGLLASFIGTFFVNVKESADQKSLLTALRKGIYVSAALSAIGAYPVLAYALDFANHPERMGVYGAVISGLLAGVIIGYVTEYYTSDHYKPTKSVADASLTGPATIIIGGLSVGMISVVIPVIIIGASLMISYFLAGGATSFEYGLYGIGISAVGMLSTLAITLTTDAYGPIADNAGGIAQMAKLPEEVRIRTDALDALGNTTAATGKGFCIGSAALTALALIVSYIDEIKQRIPDTWESVLRLEITNPQVLVGLFLGAMITFLFSAMTIRAVGNAAQTIVKEVRRQFSTNTGILEGTSEPDYATCIDICTRGSQKEMIPSAVVAVLSPIAIGLVLGAPGVIGMLAGATATGFVLALMMANAGGAWDNAKKYIEAGNHGGKGSDPHKAAVVGDTVGDPLKDTSGPAVDILIKLMSMVSIVFVGLILNFSIF
ncbi:MAG: sodium-translocating pyrophosphatase [Treponema sp.]|nr:sodium-translocating pyrophosphatase [Treponema sp.]